MQRTFLSFSIILIVFLFFFDESKGQGLVGGGGDGGSRIEGKFKFLPLPYINYDRSLGFSIGALPMAMFNPVEKDTISPSSVVGILGMYTTNDTWFGMGFGKFYFFEDDWRFTTAGGLGSVNFQFYVDNPVNGWIPYNTEIDLFLIQAERKIIKNLYGGISYVYMKFNTELKDLEYNSTVTLNGLGLNLSIDKRSNVYYPRSGFLSNAKFFTFPDFFGNEYVSNKIELDHNHYFSTRQGIDVVAGRLFAGIGIGDLSFNQQFIVGQTDIRGYTQGEFRGNNQLALQGEYRWNFHPRIGAVGFLGVTTIFDAINSNDNGKILPGVGTGFRYTVSKDTQFKVGLDVAAGLNDWGIYFRIGESF